MTAPLPVGDALADRFAPSPKQKPWQRPSDRTPRQTLTEVAVAFVPIYSTSRRPTAEARRLAGKQWRKRLIAKAKAEGRKSWRWLHEPIRRSTPPGKLR